jgi:hypothetical protein
MGVVEDSSDSHRILVLAIETEIEMARLASFTRMSEAMYAFAFTLRTHEALWPTDALKVGDTLLFRREPFNDLKQGRLNRLRGLFWRVFLHDSEV